MIALRAVRRLAWRRRYVVSDVEGEHGLQVARFAPRDATEDAARRYTRATGHASVVQRVTRLFGVPVGRRSLVAYHMALDGLGRPYLREIRVE